MNNNDEKLLRALHNGNPGAFETLFHRHKNQIYDFSYKMLGNKESAGDVTQEVFIKLFKNQNNPAKINNLRNWLFILTRNLCLNRIRDTKNEISIESISSEKIEAKKYSDLQILKLQRALIKLEPNLRESLILREYQGFSYKEMSEILGLSTSAVKSLLFRARLKLKEIFEKTN